jgi:hypothetical protein
LCSPCGSRALQLGTVAIGDGDALWSIFKQRVVTFDKRRKGIGLLAILIVEYKSLIAISQEVNCGVERPSASRHGSIQARSFQAKPITASECQLVSKPIILFYFFYVIISKICWTFG